MRFLQFLPFSNIVLSQDDNDFIPPEERFDFGNMNRKFIRNEENPEKNALNYEMKTIRQSRIEKEAQKNYLQKATPAELEIIFEHHRKDFELGQDLALLDDSADIANMPVMMKSHRCDACRLIAMYIGQEFWRLEEIYSRYSRKLSEDVLLEEFCKIKNWERVGLTQTALGLDPNTGKPVLDEWRMTGPGFETWDIRGEVTATSQLWPTRFSKMCAELVETFGEEELYRFWKNVTADSAEEPKTSDLDDLFCFSGKSGECNRFRNPSKVKTAPKTESILEEYRTFEKEINERRQKEKERDRKNMLDEQKRLMNLAIEREKAAQATQSEAEAEAKSETELPKEEL